ARGILEAIFWKPAFRWEIRSITVLKPIKTLSVMRNEIEDRQSAKPIIVEEKRQQRVSLVLKDVEYVIAADIVLVWKSERIEKYRIHFGVRLAQGSSQHPQYLGPRYFASCFDPKSENEMPAVAIDNQYLGVIFFDIFYKKSKSRRDMRFLRHKPSNAESQKQ